MGGATRDLAPPSPSLERVVETPPPLARGADARCASPRAKSLDVGGERGRRGPASDDDDDDVDGVHRVHPATSADGRSPRAPPKPPNSMETLAARAPAPEFSPGADDAEEEDDDGGREPARAGASGGIPRAAVSARWVLGSVEGAFEREVGT